MVEREVALEPQRLADPDLSRDRRPATSPISTDPAWFAETLAALRRGGLPRGGPGRLGRAGAGPTSTRVRPRVRRRPALDPARGRRPLAAAGSRRRSSSSPTGRPRQRLAGPALVGAPVGALAWSDLGRRSPRAGSRIGAHGRTHRRLDRCDDADGRARAARLARRDRARIGVPCRLLAYPYGHPTAGPSRGRCGCSTRRSARGQALASSRDDAFNLPRIDAYYLRSERVSTAWSRAGWALAGRPSGGALAPAAPRSRSPRPASGDARRARQDGGSLLPGLPRAGRGRRRAAGCGGHYPTVAGLPDLRLESDRYLDLDAERAKAERLAAIAATTDLEGVGPRLLRDHPRRRSAPLRALPGPHPRRRGPRRGAWPTSSSDGPILEVGCGTGGLLVAAARRGLTIEGVDIAARWLVVARRRLDDAGLSAAADGRLRRALPWPDGSFDDGRRRQRARAPRRPPRRPSASGDGCSGPAAGSSSGRPTGSRRRSTPTSGSGASACSRARGRRPIAGSAAAEPGFRARSRRRCGESGAGGGLRGGLRRPGADAAGVGHDVRGAAAIGDARLRVAAAVRPVAGGARAVRADLGTRGQEGLPKGPPCGRGSSGSRSCGDRPCRAADPDGPSERPGGLPRGGGHRGRLRVRRDGSPGATARAGRFRHGRGRAGDRRRGCSSWCAAGLIRSSSAKRRAGRGSLAG